MNSRVGASTVCSVRTKKTRLNPVRTIAIAERRSIEIQCAQSSVKCKTTLIRSPTKIKKKKFIKQQVGISECSRWP